MRIKAILTGHSRGLGAAVAAELTARGVAVLGVARNRVPPSAGGGGPTLRQVALDLADTAAVVAWATGDSQTSPAGFLADADVALLINNAGLLQPVGPAGACGASAVARTVAVNVAAPLALTDAFIAVTANGAAAADRRVLHVSSGAGRSAYPGWSVYCATKAALDHHARAAALDGVAGLRIASLAPGVIDTDMQAEIRSAPAERFPLRDRFLALKADGGLATPEAAARGLVAYLLSAAFAADPVCDLRSLPGG